MYGQVQERLGNLVLRHDWGWVESNRKYNSVFMIQPAAPDCLSPMFGVELKLINIIQKHVLVGDMVTC